MRWPLRFGFRMGVVSINASQVCLKSLPNFHSKNSTAFRLIIVAEIQQRFTSNVSQHEKCYSHQAFNVRMWQWGCPIFAAKIQQSFAFGALWHTGRVQCLCIRRVLTCSQCNELKPFKVAIMLMRVAYTGKPMSLANMGQDNHTAMIVHTIQHEYAPIEIVLSTYPYYMIQSSHDQKGSLTQSPESIIQSTQSPTHTQAYIYIYIYTYPYIHTLCTMQSHRTEK